MKKFTKLFGALLLSSMMFFSAPAMAQNDNPSTAQVADRDDDDDDMGKWGLLGLLGLLGLIGLKRKDDDHRDRDRVNRNV